MLRLIEDHKHAKLIGDTLNSLAFVKTVKPVVTNLIIFELKEEMRVGHLLKIFEENDIHATKAGHQLIRMVTHLGISFDDTNKVINTLKSINI